MSDHTEASNLPEEILALVAAIEAVPGVTKAHIEKTYLPDIRVSDLSLAGPYALLPIASLRRSNGALPEELLLSLDFEIEKSVAGLKAAEFLSWWTRDQSRGGENMQIRSIGLPPQAGNQVQLGHTLYFTIDWFYADPQLDMKKLLSAIAGKAGDIRRALDMYKSTF